jgi:hypothetical protein
LQSSFVVYKQHSILMKPMEEMNVEIS